MESGRHQRQARRGRPPLNASTPKMKLAHASEEQLEDLKNVSYESDHTELPSVLSPVEPSSANVASIAKPKMTQSAAKKKGVAHAAPVVKNAPRRGSRSRSRGRNSRRSTPVRSTRSTPDPALAQTVNKSDTSEKLSPLVFRRPLRNTTMGDPVQFENSSVKPTLKSHGSFHMEKPKNLLLRGSNFLAGYPYILSFLHFIVCIFYAFLFYKAVTYFGADRFLIKHWNRWFKSIRPNTSL